VIFDCQFKEDIKMFVKHYKYQTGLFLLLIFIFGCSIQREKNTNKSIQSLENASNTTFVKTSQDFLNDEISQSRENAITRAVSRISPAVVGINVVQIRRYREYSPFDQDPFWGWFFRPREYLQKVKSLGSGFLISSDGYILTNEHVVSEASEIIVTTTDGKQYKAKSVGEDRTYDVALLKIKGEKFPFISLGNSSDIIIGEWVIALGNPFGLFDVSSNPTVTVGVVSATGMDFKRVENHTYNDMIQTDAAINGGNSGGPLVNSLGYCIGINTFIISGSEYKGTSLGIGFAIPINRVKKILPHLKKIGQANKTFETGLEVENINWLVARMLGISTRDGVIISRIARKSPAEKAELEVGDIIVAINGQRITSKTDVQNIINSIDVKKEKSLTLTIFRDGKLYETDLILEKIDM
jgi:serine protease Do